jgi:hypothetical protein
MQELSGNLVAILVPLGFFAVIFGVLYVIVQHRTRTQAQRLELHTKLLERIGSAREFGEFLSTDAGERFLKTVSDPRHEARLLWSVGAGVVLATVGAALFIGLAFKAFGDTDTDLVVFTTIVAATGVGLLLASAINYAFARRLGVLTAPPPQTQASTR